MSEGWRCPGCKRCYAPDVRECMYCQPAYVPGSIEQTCSCGSTGGCPIHDSWANVTTTFSDGQLHFLGVNACPAANAVCTCLGVSSQEDATCPIHGVQLPARGVTIDWGLI